MSNWKTICSVADLKPSTGVCALFEGEQVAVFMGASKNDLYAVSNYDPFGKASVLSRGLIGSVGETVYVASPLYKQRFDLMTGQCLDDTDVSLKTYQIKVDNNDVQLCRESA